MKILRALFSSIAIIALAACGDLSSDLENAKQEAVTIGREALEVAGGEVDTRTACMLAGQSEAFCGCLSERLGAEITPEQIGAVTDVVGATVSGETNASGETIASSETNASSEDAPTTTDASTRQAIVECATRAAIDGAVSEGAN